MKDKLVWYVAYGSNLLRERFMIYINGGRFKANGKPYDGCKNKTPPIKDKPYLLPYELYFGNESPSWDMKGVAFIDANKEGITLGRAYLITEEQFLEIQSQEGCSDKWYGHIVKIANDSENIPYNSFTSKKRNLENNPSEKYLKIFHMGLCETYPQLMVFNDFINF